MSTTQRTTSTGDGDGVGPVVGVADGVEVAGGVATTVEIGGMGDGVIVTVVLVDVDAGA